MIKKSYATPKRVEKNTQKIINAATIGATVGKSSLPNSSRQEDQLLKGLTKFNQTSRQNKHALTFTGSMLHDEVVPQIMEENTRINFFDNSDDRLGRLAEINKS